MIHKDARCLIDVYFSDREPAPGIPCLAPARRVRAFRSNDWDVSGDPDLSAGRQYSLRVRSDAGVVAQYGRADISQPSPACVALMGHREQTGVRP